MYLAIDFVCEYANTPKYSNILALYCTCHYENMPIQIYWKFSHQKMKKF